MGINEVLEMSGMKDTEVEIYLYLLKNGAKSQQQISDDTSILRQTVYDLMSKMESRGFVSSVLVGKRKSYSAIEPKFILKKLKEREDEFLQILPVLEKMSLSNTSEIFSESFVGISGLKNLFNMTLDSSTEILWIANEKMHDEVFQDYYWKNYALKRVEAKVVLKMIVEKEYANSSTSTNKKLFREIRSNSFAQSLSSSFVVFEDKIIIYSIKQNQLFGVFIQSESLNLMFKQIFMSYWQKSKQI